MYLKEAQIKNYRSIEYLKLNFSSALKVFVGKNESGKSNIIKALSLLSPDIQSSAQDIRETLPNETLAEESYVRFVYNMDSKDLDLIYNNVSNKFSPSIDIENPIIDNDGTKLSLKEFCVLRSQVLYIANVEDSNKHYANWELSTDNYNLTQELVKEKGTETKAMSQSAIIPMAEVSLETKEQERVTIDDIDELINIEKIKMLKTQHPIILYWTYNEENLLPSRIDITEFSTDPDTCKPLKNLFQLAGISEIKDAIDIARKGSSNKYRNFLNKIAEHATLHFRETWKEYKGISFSLEPNGDYVEAGIKEKNTYTFQQRSDGFKRFITFLLMVSVNVKSDKLKNAFILVDEPDVSLHPSGVRFLRDELKKISKKNIVVVATHSIFMIDGDNFENYLIVKKEDEKTTVEIPTELNIATEEVLYRALDFSIYELLKDKNILFEGWRDKRLFQVAISKLPSELKSLKEFYKNIGISHTSGVKNVKNITPIFELVNKKCLIISDSDKAAKDKQKEFNKEHNVGTWLRYDEIDADSLATTGEDYLSSSLIEKGIKELKATHIDIQGDPDLNLKKGVVANIENWLKTQGLNDNSSQYIDEFKTFLFEELKPADISPTYYSLLKKLSEYIIVHEPKIEK